MGRNSKKDKNDQKNNTRERGWIRQSLITTLVVCGVVVVGTALVIVRLK